MGAADAGICDHDVDVAYFFLDLLDYGLESILGCDVADERDDVVCGDRGSGCFKGVFAPADDIDFVSAIEGEGAGHHETDTWG